MHFEQTKLDGAWLISPDLIEDERGCFARTWCQMEFAAHGLKQELVQCNISQNKAAGTLRGMHWQAAPHGEVKLVRCTSGAIFDVIVDVRTASVTFGEWFGVELSASNRCMLYIPEGFAHGFVTLHENTEVFYQMSDFYVPELSRGMHWADDEIAIEWPHAVNVVSDRDNDLPTFKALFPPSIARRSAA